MYTCLHIHVHSDACTHVLYMHMCICTFMRALYMLIVHMCVCMCVYVVSVSLTHHHPFLFFTYLPGL